MISSLFKWWPCDKEAATVCYLHIWLFFISRSLLARWSQTIARDMLCAILFQCVIGTYLKYRKKGRVLERSLKEMSHIFFILEIVFFWKWRLLPILMINSWLITHPCFCFTIHNSYLYLLFLIRCIIAFSNNLIEAFLWDFLFDEK